ncbi:MAG: type IV secretion system protein [Rhodopila sp.]|jgi:type IV secretion system protein VirB6
MNQTPFTNMATDFGVAFGAGTQTAITALLAAVAAPLLACVTLWIIVQGILVMRGDLDARGGITRIIKVALVVGILTSSGLYTTYVQTLFITTIPNWFATAAGGTQAAITSTPATFDNMWQVTEHAVESINAQIAVYDIVDAVSVSLIELSIMVLLVVTFAIYEFALIATGIMVAIGPVIIVGYLFEATKGVTDRWIGKLITYSLLTLLINVTLNIVLTGEKAYMRVILTQQASGLTAVPAEIKVLIELAMFFAMGAFIVVSLPAIAAALGGGVGASPGAAIMNAFTNLAVRAATPKRKAA